MTLTLTSRTLQWYCKRVLFSEYQPIVFVLNRSSCNCCHCWNDCDLDLEVKNTVCLLQKLLLEPSKSRSEEWSKKILLKQCSSIHLTYIGCDFDPHARHEALKFHSPSG